MRKILLLFFIIGFFGMFFSNSASAELFKKKYSDTPYEEYLYQQKVLRKLEVEKYERSLLPPSGFMTRAQYESLSKDVPNSEKVIPEPKLPKDIKMKYVPQPTYKMVRYNNPPGSPEIKINLRFKTDKQENAQGIASPDRSILVYPVLYYYSQGRCTSGELYVIPLDKTLPDVDRLLRANIIKRDPNPILATEKSVNVPNTFRTMTPIDFSPDGSLLLAKEKIGNDFDGIWKTNVWVYDFNTKQGRNLVEVRDAVRHYWLNATGEILDDKRWDIYPLGFQADDPTKIVVNAYGFTGAKPKFLGTWRIDYTGERSELVSLFNAEANISTNGLKLVQDSIVNPAVIAADEKEQDKIIKERRKKEKKAVAKVKKEKKAALNKKLKEMKKQESVVVKQYKKQQRVSAPTAVD